MSDCNSLIIRAERLIKGDVILWYNTTWRVSAAEKTSLTKIRLVLEPIETDTWPVRTTVERGLVFRVLLLV